MEGECIDKCPINTFEIDSTCFKCTDGCLGCSDVGLSSCDSCDTTKGLIEIDEGLCEALICSSGHVLFGSSCVECDNSCFDCDGITSGDCVSCSTGF